MALLVASGVTEGDGLGEGVGEGATLGVGVGVGVGVGAGVAAGATGTLAAGVVDVNWLPPEAKAVHEKTMSAGAALFSLMVKPDPDRPCTTNLTSPVRIELPAPSLPEYMVGVTLTVGAEA